MVKCWKCLKLLSFTAGDSISRREECPFCSSDLRCCKACEFYSKTSYNECAEPMAERIIEKEKANYCDFFRLGTKDPQEKTKSALDLAKALFKD
jgi:hypothetical protein